MNRQILFRGRKGNVWYFGDLQRDQDGSTFISFYDEIEHARRVKPVDSETVGQFTGLIDKNGKQIFEGDIVRFDDYCCVEKVTTIAMGVVNFSDAEFCIEQISGIDRGWMNSFYNPDGRSFSWNELEIIGNIFDRDSS